MKGSVLSLLVLSTLFSVTAFGMSRGLPKIEDESVYDAKVVSSFNLRASDGSVLKFSAPIDRALNSTAGLPAERNADYSKCEKAGKIADTDLFLKLIDLSTKLLNQRRALSSQEVALIQKTPRCEPFLNILSVISSVLAPQQSASAAGEEIKSLTLKVDKKAGAFLVVNTESAKSAPFKIASDLKALKIHELRDFTQVQIPASRSGQNVGIRFSLDDISDSDPTQSRDHERCDYTHSERQCHYDHESGREKCEYVTITEPGERRVRTTSNFTTYDLKMELVDASNRVLATGKVMDSEFNSDNEYGPCIPFGRDSDRDFRDYRR